jgi:hypothetical protein
VTTGDEVIKMAVRAVPDSQVPPMGVIFDNAVPLMYDSRVIYNTAVPDSQVPPVLEMMGPGVSGGRCPTRSGTGKRAGCRQKSWRQSRRRDTRCPRLFRSVTLFRPYSGPCVARIGLTCDSCVACRCSASHWDSTTATWCVLRPCVCVCVCATWCVLRVCARVLRLQLIQPLALAAVSALSSALLSPCGLQHLQSLLTAAESAKLRWCRRQEAQLWAPLDVFPPHMGHLLLCNWRRGYGSGVA